MIFIFLNQRRDGARFNLGSVEHNFSPLSEDWEKIERLTNYGSVNRSQLLTCLLRFHRLTELPPSGLIPVGRRRRPGCESGLFGTKMRAD
jgi:hypothetical protein